MRHMFHSIHQANFSKLSIESNRFRVIYLLLANSNRRHDICQLNSSSFLNQFDCLRFICKQLMAFYSIHLVRIHLFTHKDSPLDQTPVQPQIKRLSAFNSIQLIAIICKPLPRPSTQLDTQRFISLTLDGSQLDEAHVPFHSPSKLL